MSSILPPDDYEGLVNRGAAARRMEEIMGPAHDLLLEELRYGLGLFERVFRTGYDTRVADSALRLFWSFLQSLDALDELIRGGVIGPAHVQARSLVEIGLQLLYVLQRNDERFAAAYTTHGRRQHLAAADLFASGGRRAEMEEHARRTRNVPDDFVADLPDTQDEADRLRESLEGDLWREANEELLRRGRWYQAFGGPQNLRELAEAVNMDLWYTLIYSPYSDVVHRGRPERPFIPMGEGRLRIAPLRDPTGWDQVVAVGDSMTYEVLTDFTRHFRPDEERALVRWLLEEIRPRRARTPLRQRELEANSNGGR